MAARRMSRVIQTICGMWCIANMVLLSAQVVDAAQGTQKCNKATVTPAAGGGTCCCDLDYWNECEINYAAGACTGTCTGAASDVAVAGGCVAGTTTCIPGVGARQVNTVRWDCDATNTNWSECNTATVATDCKCASHVTSTITVPIADCT